MLDPNINLNASNNESYRKRPNSADDGPFLQYKKASSSLSREATPNLWKFKTAHYQGLDSVDCVSALV
jgi:hypothetical protein